MNHLPDVEHGLQCLIIPIREFIQFVVCHYPLRQIEPDQDPNIDKHLVHSNN